MNNNNLNEKNNSFCFDQQQELEAEDYLSTYSDLYLISQARILGQDILREKNLKDFEAKFKCMLLDILQRLDEDEEDIEELKAMKRNPQEYRDFEEFIRELNEEKGGAK